jgi:hypothetical protein
MSLSPFKVIRDLHVNFKSVKLVKIHATGSDTHINNNNKNPQKTIEKGRGNSFFTSLQIFPLDFCVCITC